MVYPRNPGLPRSNPRKPVFFFFRPSILLGGGNLDSGWDISIYLSGGFNPVEKRLVKMDHFPQVGVNIKDV